MTRTLLFALLLASSAGLATEASAEAPGPTMIPGRDGELERARRSAPVGPWGLAPWCVLAGVGIWRSRRAIGAGSPRRARTWLMVTGLVVGGGLGETALRVTQDDWTLHVKVRDGCYHDNPRGYFEAMRYADDPSTLAYCAGPLTDVWARCDKASTGDGSKLLALGDSFTDGVGVFARDTWPAQLDQALGDGVQVINCGKAASDTALTAQRYLSHRSRHGAKDVVYAFVLNDVMLPGGPALDGTDIAFQLPNRGAYEATIASHPLLGPLARQSALARLLIERGITRRVHTETLASYHRLYAPENQAAFDEAMDLIAAMDTLVSEAGGHLLVVIWPLLEDLDAYPFVGVHAQVAAALKERSVATLDLLPTFLGHDAGALHVHPTDHHPNELAHGMASAAIAGELRRRSWPP